MTRFSWYPVTIERPWSEVPITIASIAEYAPDAPEGGALGEVGIFFPAATQYALVDTIQALNDQQFVFTDPAGRQVTLRQTRADDAESWPEIWPRYPLPVEVIGALLQSTIPDPNLTAAVDGDGDVHTLILETNLGLYARYSRTWIRLADATPIEQLYIVDISPESLNAYDDADVKGEMVNIRDLNTAAGEANEVIPSAPTTPVTAAGAVRTVIVASMADVPAAIEFAATPDGAASRFYVERRAKALGYSDPFPWQEP